MKQKTVNAVISALAIILMWAVWISAYFIVNNDYILPSVSDTFAQMGGLFASAQFWRSFGMTLWRTFYAWVIACLAAAVFATASAVSNVACRLVAPFVAALRVLPTMAVTLMLLVWTSPKVAPVIVAFMMLFPLVYTQITAAYKGIDKGLIEMADVYRVSKKDRIFKIYLPQMLPPVLAQTGANFSLTLKVMVSAEVMSATFTSLGGMINDASMYLQVAEMFALTIIVIVVGGVMEYLLGKLALITRRWSGGAKEAK